MFDRWIKEARKSNAVAAQAANVRLRRRGLP